MIDFFKSAGTEQINGSEKRDITLKIGGKGRTIQGETYLLNFVLPNFYFHITIAYGILRHNGLDIGKNDYLGVH